MTNPISQKPHLILVQLLHHFNNNPYPDIKPKFKPKYSPKNTAKNYSKTIPQTALTFNHDFKQQQISKTPIRKTRTTPKTNSLNTIHYPHTTNTTKIYKKKNHYNTNPLPQQI